MSEVTGTYYDTGLDDTTAEPIGGFSDNSPDVSSIVTEEEGPSAPESWAWGSEHWFYWYDAGRDERQAAASQRLDGKIGSCSLDDSYVLILPSLP